MFQVLFVFMIQWNFLKLETGIIDSQPLAGHLRAFHPTLVGYDFGLGKNFEFVILSCFRKSFAELILYWSVLHSVTLFDNLSAILRIYVIVREAQTWFGQSPL